MLVEFIDFFIEWWILKCLSANLALQEFFQAINFRFTWTTKWLQPVTSTRVFASHAIKYHKIAEYSCGKWPTVSLFFTTFMANSLTALSGSCSAWSFFPSAAIHLVSPKSFLFMPRWWPGSGPDSSQHLKLCLFFQCQRNFNFLASFEVILLKNRIERAF